MGIASVSASLDIEPDHVVRIAEALAVQRQGNIPPHWDTIPLDLRPVLLQMDKKLRAAAAKLDEHLRAAGALRLPLFDFPRRPANSSNAWSTAKWRLSKEEQEWIVAALEDEEKERFIKKHGWLEVPLPNSFESRHVYPGDPMVEEVTHGLQGDEVLPPSFSLFGAAWSLFERRSFAAATIMVASAIETAVKWHLTQNGDSIAGWLIEEMASPTLKKLADCAHQRASLALPERFRPWLVSLTEARNAAAHKPAKRYVHPLQLARWFALGEALLRATRGANEIDDRVGLLIKATKTTTYIQEATVGVVMRREETHGEDNYHVMLIDGTVRRFGVDGTGYVELTKKEEKNFWSSSIGRG